MPFSTRQLIHTSLFFVVICNGLYAKETLFFPASKIEPERRYTIKNGENSLSKLDFPIKSGRLASTLLEFLHRPSKSCEESENTQLAKQELQIAGKPLGIEVYIDDLPTQLAELSQTQQTDYYCNSGKKAPESGNLIAYIPGNIAAPSWNLSFHLDTNQLKFDGFRQQGDIIYPANATPLGADDKAGIAIIIEIVRTLAEQNIPHGDIRIVGLVAEEDSAAGARLIDAEAFKGDILISIDGTDPHKIGRAAPTMYSGYITVESQTSHPASVDRKRSVSACAVGTKILSESGFTPEAHPPNHPNVILHSYFTSCGLNDGGLTAKGEPLASYKYNTIAPFWSAAWQMRNLEGAEKAALMTKELALTVDKVCRESEKERTPVVCTITGTDRPKLEGYVISEAAPSLRILKKGFELTDEMPIKITAQQFGGFNGNYIKARFNEEMFIVGTGASQIHTNEETVSIKGMVRVTKGVLAAMLESYRYRLVK